MKMYRDKNEKKKKRKMKTQDLQRRILFIELQAKS